MRAFVFALLMLTGIGTIAQQANPPSGPDFNSFKIVADRDIFNQSRLPHERAVQQTRVPDSFSLVGTLFYAGGDIAFFDGTRGEYHKALQVGGDLAGFKVTAVTLDSVTLSDGTNQTVLKITSQMRRDDNGHWSVSTERASYASSANTTGFNRGGYLGRSRRYNTDRGNLSNLNMTTPPTGVEGPPAPGMEDNSSAPAAAGGANDALTRLMQRRAQEEQQLGQRQ